MSFTSRELNTAYAKEASSAYIDAANQAVDLSKLKFSSADTNALLADVCSYCENTARNYNGPLAYWNEIHDYVAIDDEEAEGITDPESIKSAGPFNDPALNLKILQTYCSFFGIDSSGLESGIVPFNAWRDIKSGELNGKALIHMIQFPFRDSTQEAEIEPYYIIYSLDGCINPFYLKMYWSQDGWLISNSLAQRRAINEYVVQPDLNGDVFTPDQVLSHISDRQAAMSFLADASYHVQNFGECNQQTIQRLLDQYCSSDGVAANKIKSDVAYMRGLAPANIISIFRDFVDLGDSSCSGDNISYDLAKPLYVTDVIQYVLIGIGYVISAIFTVLSGVFAAIGIVLSSIMGFIGSAIGSTLSWKVDSDTISNPELGVSIPLVSASPTPTAYVNNVRELDPIEDRNALYAVERFGAGTRVDLNKCTALNFWRESPTVGNCLGQYIPIAIDLLQDSSAFYNHYFNVHNDGVAMYDLRHACIATCGALGRIHSVGGENPYFSMVFTDDSDSSVIHSIMPSLLGACGASDAELSRMALSGLALAILNGLSWDGPITENSIWDPTGEPASDHDYEQYIITGLGNLSQVDTEERNLDYKIRAIINGGVTYWIKYRDASGQILDLTTSTPWVIANKIAALYLLRLCSDPNQTYHRFTVDDFQQVYSVFYELLQVTSFHQVLRYNPACLYIPGSSPTYAIDNAAAPTAYLQSCSATLKQIAFTPPSGSEQVMRIAGVILAAATAIAITATAIVKRKLQNFATKKLYQRNQEWDAAQKAYADDPSKANAKQLCKANRKLTRAWNRASALGLSSYDGFSTGSDTVSAASGKSSSTINTILDKMAYESNSDIGAEAIGLSAIASLISK